MPGPHAAQEPIALVCGSDENYALPLAVTLASALEGLPAGRPVHLCLLDGGISAASRRRLVRVVDRPGVHLDYVTRDTDQFRGLTAHTWITPSTYLRFLAPDLLPAAFRRALYLDSDLLVQGDLSAVWEQDMGGCSLAAVQDPIVRTVSGGEGLANYAELGLSPDNPYFNAGVLLMNLDRWRHEDIGLRVMQYIRDYAAIIRFDDQEGLNAVLATDWLPLGPQWNLMANTLWPGAWASDELRQQGRDLQSLLAGPNVCHFAGQSKPWRPSCRYPVKGAWLRALWRSGWFTPAERALWFASYYARQYAFPLRERLLRRGAGA